MIHEPRCPKQPRSDGATLTMQDGVPVLCECDLIAKVRRDERRLMRARVEALPRWVSRGAVGYQAPVLVVGLEQVLTALHVLKERP
jgi:hypothetical protein